MKTVCVLIVSCPSIDQVTPGPGSLPHLPATPLPLCWTFDNQNVLQIFTIRYTSSSTEL